MASTYSNNLRLELIATGEQVGTWGTTANTNLGTLIETAITGYTSVSVTAANQAFTALNGAADQARYASIALTTTTGANFAVYAPPAPKHYVIKNASSFTATVYNSTVLGNTTAAGTGVAVPAGKTLCVWSDGTNMAVQTDHLLSATTAVTQSPADNSTKLSTTAYTDAAIAAAKSALFPVGAIYMGTVSTNPATLLGFGTWTALAAGRMLMGAGDAGYPAGTTGGSANAIVVSHSHTVTGTAASGGSHAHGVTDPTHTHLRVSGGGSEAVLRNDSGGGQSFGAGPFLSQTQTTTNASATGISINADGAHTHTVSGTTSTDGVSATNANLPPYLVVYMWQRTA